MSLVVDASAIVRFLVRGPGASEVSERLERQSTLAPSLLLIEVANAMWKMQRTAALTSEEARGLATRASKLVDELVPVDQLHEPALDLAIQLNHPVYDCLYLVLTRDRDGVLLTADKRLHLLAGDLGIASHLIS